MKRSLRRRILCAAVTLLFVLSVRGQALAAGVIRPVRVFVYENTLYSYMELEDIHSPVTQAEVKIGNQSFPASGRLETVRQAGFPITYLLLVDNSTSMPPFREQLVEFGSQLASGGGENTRFILATLGDDFQILSEDVPAAELGAQLAAMPFDENVTRLHTCIDSALDYFEQLPRQGAELREMVVITDAVQYDPAGGVPYEELLERIRQSDVMLHSLGLGTDAGALERLGKLTEASGGIHQVPGTELTAAAAADVLSETGGNLMVTGFDLEGCTASGEDQKVSFTFASRGTLVGSGEASVDLPGAGTDSASETAAPEEAEGEESSPSSEEQESGGQPGQESGSSQSDQEGTPQQAGQEDGSSQPDQEDTPQQTEPADGSSAAEQENTSSAGTAPQQPSGTGMLPLLIGAGAALAVVILIWLLAGRKKSKSKTQALPAPDAPGIYMRIDDQDHVLASGQTEFTLSGELTVGRDAGCSLVLNSSTAPLKAARIFVDNGFVRLEVLDPQASVQVNGEPAEGVRTLRSGDRISIDGLTFRPLF